MEDDYADPEAQRASDLVQRDFTATAPDRLWVGDFTYLRSWEGRSFFSFIIDVFSRMIVGWQIARHMRTSLVLDALRMALAIRQPGADFELVSHNDHGSQYTAEDYTSSSTMRTCWRRSGRSATATTTRSPIVRRQLQDRADRRSRVALPRAARARDRRLRRLVQHAPAAPSLGNVPPVEHEQRHVAALAADPEALLSPTGSVTLEPLRGVRPLRGRLRCEGG